MLPGACPLSPGAARPDSPTDHPHRSRPSAPPEARLPADDALDPAALEKLERLGGPGFADRIVGIFLRDAPGHVARAEAALARRDGAELAYAAHALISTAANIGATGLEALVRQLERDAQAGAWDALPAQVARLAAAHASLAPRLAARPPAGDA